MGAFEHTDAELPLVFSKVSLGIKVRRPIRELLPWPRGGSNSPDEVWLQLYRRGVCRRHFKVESIGPRG